MGSFHKNILLMSEFLKAPFLVLHFFYYTLMTFLVLSIILPSMLMILFFTLSVMRSLEVSELESNLVDTVDWGTKWLVDFSSGKAQIVSFDWAHNAGAIDMKMDRSVI